MQVVHCTRVSSQGVKWEEENSSISIPQTCSVYLEMRDLYLIHMKALNSAQVTCLAQHPPTGDPVNQQSLHTDAGPLIFPTREAMPAPIFREVGKGLRPRLWALLSAAGGSKDPFQSPLDPGLSHFLISHLHSAPLPILSVQV